MKWLLLLTALLMCMAHANAQTPSPDVKAELLTDHAQVVAGGAFAVGVLLNLPEGWHVYWKYPGDSGLATRVKWNLPAGFTASELLWPAPTRFVQAGNIEGYGYEHQVMLMARITAPRDFTGTAALGADVRWLVCKDVCVPGRAQLQVSVLIGGTAERANVDVFDSWLKRVPTDVSAQPNAVVVHKDGLHFDLTVKGWAASDTGVFVAPPDGFSTQSVTPSAEHVAIQFKQLPGEHPAGQAEVVFAKEDKPVRVLLPLP